jgi:hypothetical protein
MGPLLASLPRTWKSAETSSKYWDQQVLGELSDRSEGVLSRFVTKMQCFDGRTPEFQDRRLEYPILELDSVFNGWETHSVAARPEPAPRSAGMAA